MKLAYKRCVIGVTRSSQKHADQLKHGGQPRLADEQNYA